MKAFSVALVSDLIEENWPSMDLVSDMLYERLLHLCSDECRVSQLRPAMRRRFSNAPLVGARSFTRNADRLINRFLDYPRWLRKVTMKFDLFHVIDHSYAQVVHELPPGRTVVSCHDLDTFRCLLEPSREPRSWLFRQMVRRILDGLSRAAHILCDSQTVRNQLLSFGIVSPERVSVILHGVHPSCSRISDPVADAEAERILQMDADAVYLLHVGSTIPRKRIDLLLRVFASVRKTLPSVRLVRVGGPFTRAQLNLASQLGILNSISVLPHIDRRTLVAVYQRAALLLLTSEAEGFGFAPVEAMACGCPPVVSDIPVLREVGETAAVYCPIEEVSTWSETVIQLLRERVCAPDVWEKRRTVATTCAARFTWEQSAAECIRIYKKILE